MPEARTAGAMAKIFGVILMALGALNSMLSWRSAIAEGDFHLIMLLAGAFVYAIGAILGAGRKRAEQ